MAVPLSSNRSLNGPPVAYDADLERLEIELLLEGVFRHYGFDFRSYAYASIRRRLWKRVEGEGLRNISALQARILHDPEAMERLLLDLSVNVTAMFRDPSFYREFRERVVLIQVAVPSRENVATYAALGQETDELVGQINGVRSQAAGIAQGAATPAEVKTAAAQLSAKADDIRKEIVATKEGGAITGEERLREHTDQIYGAILSVEDRPTAYQMARIDALDRELKDVEAAWAAMQSGDVAAFNAKLRAANLPPLTIAEIRFDPDDLARGGRASALARGLVGTHFYGDAASLQETAERD